MSVEVWILNLISIVLVPLYDWALLILVNKLLFVLSLIAAPLLVRRARRDEASRTTGLCWPGVVMLVMSWVFFAWTSFMSFVAVYNMDSHYINGGLQLAKSTLDETARFCLLALLTSAWTALCAAVGVVLTTSPARATLRHGLIVSVALSGVALGQLVLFDTLGALLTEPTVILGAEAVLPLIRRLEWALGATAVAFVVAGAAAWRGGRRGLWHFGLWQTAAVALTVLPFGAWIFGRLLTYTPWSAQRVALDLPYPLPQRPLGAPSRAVHFGSDVCARDGTGWRCSRLELETVEFGPPPATLALPQDTLLAALQPSDRKRPNTDNPNTDRPNTEVLDLNYVDLLVCAGSPRASTRGLERWFPPDLAACSVLSLRSEGPYTQPEASDVVIEVARDWTVQRLVDEVNRRSAQGEVWVRWAREPG
jgi:hypothetical protein